MLQRIGSFPAVEHLFEIAKYKKIIKRGTCPMPGASGQKSSAVSNTKRQAAKKGCRVTALRLFSFSFMSVLLLPIRWVLDSGRRRIENKHQANYLRSIHSKMSFVGHINSKLAGLFALHWLIEHCCTLVPNNFNHCAKRWPVHRDTLKHKGKARTKQKHWVYSYIRLFTRRDSHLFCHPITPTCAGNWFIHRGMSPSLLFIDAPSFIFCFTFRQPTDYALHSVE